MASAMPPAPLNPLFTQHKLFISLSPKKLRCQWRIMSTIASRYAGSYTRISFRSLNSYHPLRSSLSLRHLSPLPSLSLHPLFQPRLPSLQSPLTSSMSLPLASPHPPSFSSSSTKTVRVMIKGRVQGVFYRNWTIENATQLGLKGWVRNRMDGSVEALFSGDSDKVQEMEQRCRRGPPDAMVTALQVFPCNDDPGTRFELKPTI